MAREHIGIAGIGLRFLFALALVCLTWNPTAFNYVEWALARWRDMGPLVAFAGIIIGAPTLRLKSDYLALVTLAFGEIIRVIVARHGRIAIPRAIGNFAVGRRRVIDWQ